MINIHRHCFGIQDVPESFIRGLKWMTKRMQDKTKRASRLASVLDKMLPGKNDSLSRYGDFVRMYDKSMREVMRDGTLDGETTSGFLTMDMRFMGRGSVPRRYLEQLEETAQTIRSRKFLDGVDGLIFVHLDPRDVYLMDTINWMVKNADVVAGIKLYCPLGYYPDDEVLMVAYNFAEANNWPVIAHCTKTSPVHYSGRGLNKMLNKKAPSYKKALSKKNKCANFAHPEHLIRLAKARPKLKVCAAHFGGGKTWRDALVCGMIVCPNLFVDTSFTYNEAREAADLVRLLELNLVIAGQVLFGTDHYMTKTLKDRAGFTEYKKIFPPELLIQLTETNPNAFLNHTEAS